MQWFQLRLLSERYHELAGFCVGRRFAGAWLAILWQASKLDG